MFINTSQPSISSSLRPLPTLHASIVRSEAPLSMDLVNWLPDGGITKSRVNGFTPTVVKHHADQVACAAKVEVWGAPVVDEPARKAKFLDGIRVRENLLFIPDGPLMDIVDGLPIPRFVGRVPPKECAPLVAEPEVRKLKRRGALKSLSNLRLGRGGAKRAAKKAGKENVPAL